MKLKIVKLNNGKFALRQGFFFRKYADIMDLTKSRPIYWWTSMEHSNNFTVDHLNDLLELVDKYVTSNTEEIEEEEVMCDIDLNL